MRAGELRLPGHWVTCMRMRWCDLLPCYFIYDIFASCRMPAITDWHSPHTPALDATFATQAQRMLSRHGTPLLGPGHAICCSPARCGIMICMLWRGPHVVALQANTSHLVACSVLMRTLPES